MEKKLILFQKSYDLLLWLYPVVNRIPKFHKTILGRQIQELGLSILLLVQTANKARGVQRKEIQLVISEELDKLRILIRLTKDLRFMSIKQYEHGAEKINEVGKILSGWMRTTANQNAVANDTDNLSLF